MTPISGPQRSSRTCSETCCTLSPRRSSQRRPPETSRRLFEAHPRLRTVSDALQEPSAGCTKPKTSTAPTKPLGRFADLYATGQIPEYHDIVDTIIAWGEEILVYHTS